MARVMSSSSPLKTTALCTDRSEELTSQLLASQTWRKTKYFITNYMFSQGWIMCITEGKWTVTEGYKWLWNEPRPDWSSDPLVLFCIGMPGPDWKEMGMTRHFYWFLKPLVWTLPGVLIMENLCVVFFFQQFIFIMHSLKSRFLQLHIQISSGLSAFWTTKRQWKHMRIMILTLPLSTKRWEGRQQRESLLLLVQMPFNSYCIYLYTHMCGGKYIPGI